MRRLKRPPVVTKLTKSQAKKWACAETAGILLSQLSVGWPSSEDYRIDDKTEALLIEAVRELIKEFERRGKDALKLGKD